MEIRFGDRAHPDNIPLIRKMLLQFANANESEVASGADIRATGMRFVVQLKRRLILELTDPLEEE